MRRRWTARAASRSARLCETQEESMAKVLVLYYSDYGHIEKMAD
jgi:hypothetical protein